MDDEDIRQALGKLATEQSSFDLDEPTLSVLDDAPDQLERHLWETLTWIKEKIGTVPNAPKSIRDNARFAAQPRWEHDPQDHTAMMFVAGTLHEARWRRSDKAYVRSVEQSIGLRSCTSTPFLAVRSSVADYGYDLAATLDGIAADLSQNSAVLVRLRTGTQGHAIAMFKSRLGVVYFFDAKLGIFELDGNTIDWLDIWLVWYVSNCSVFVQPQVNSEDNSSWYTVYRR